MKKKLFLKNNKQTNKTNKQTSYKIELTSNDSNVINWNAGTRETVRHIQDYKQYQLGLTYTFRASCYSTRLSWAHTPAISWTVCLGKKVSS